MKDSATSDGQSSFRRKKKVRKGMGSITFILLVVFSAAGSTYLATLAREPFNEALGLVFGIDAPPTAIEVKYQPDVGQTDIKMN